MLDLEPAAYEVEQLLHVVTDDQLANRTPRVDYTVADLIDHLMGLTLAFTWAARKETPIDGEDPPGRRTVSGENLDPKWRELLPGRLHELASTWKSPSAWEGLASAGGVTLPAQVMGAVALDELVLHGWDLARGLGRPFGCDEPSTAAVLAFTTEAAKPEQAASRNGVFGPVVEVPDNATPFDRALGLSGRDPNWARPT